MPHRKISKKQQEREEELVQQARLAYLGTLAGGLAHELRSPLQAIELNLGLLQELGEHVAPEQRSRFDKQIGRIQNEVGWLSRLITEFLSFARPPRPARVPTDINQIILELIDALRVEYEALDIHFETELDENLFPVLIDVNQFSHSVIMNLLTNAKEAIGKHGRILIRTYGEDNCVLLEISDNGPGIPPEARERIFEVFFSTKNHGTGLGLGIASRLCDEMGGALQLKETGPHGTTFLVRLPESRILTFDQSDSPDLDSESPEPDDSSAPTQTPD